jgi:general secretion pathway protein A
VIRAAIDRQLGHVHTVYLPNPTLSRAEFVEILAAHFGLSSRASGSKAAFLLELENLLKQRRDRDERTVLVLDEAQSMSLELLEEVRLLANVETNEDKLLSVIIAGQPEIAERLNSPTLRQLKQRVSLRCSLRALTLGETAAYLAGRIRAAGGVGATVFTREAVRLIHEAAAGLPRTISVIADNALLGGFAIGQRPVDTHVVREVCRDFDLSAVAEGGNPMAGFLSSRNGDPDDSRPAYDRRLGFERLIEHVPPPTDAVAVAAPKRRWFSFRRN